MTTASPVTDKDIRAEIKRLRDLLLARQQARGAARHRAADPHCNCPSCTAFHFEAQGAAPAVRQTACRHCGQDIEGWAPYRAGEWRDRGNNTHCPNASGRLHAPIKVSR